MSAQNCISNLANCGIDITQFQIITNPDIQANINAGLLEDTPDSPTQPQRIILCNGINLAFSSSFFNYTFASGSEIICLQDAGFRVLPNGKLNIVGTSIHGCDKLWKGIRVSTGGTLQLNSTTLSQAINGITLSGGSTLIANNCNFRGNITSLLMKGQLSTSSIPEFTSISTDISGCVFSGDGALVEQFFYDDEVLSSPVFVTKPYRAIDVVDCPATSIGMLNSNLTTVVVKNYSKDGNIDKQVLRCKNSNLTLNGVHFINISDSQDPNADILSCIGLNNNSSNMLTVNGLNSQGIPSFSDSHIGISGVGNLSVFNAKFENINKGIYYVYPGVSTKRSYKVKIRNSSFNKYKDTAIDMYSLSRVGSLEISQNVFMDDSDSEDVFVDPALGRIAIHIYGDGGLFNGIVSQNEFVNSVKSTEFPYIGIRLFNCGRGIKIEENRFIDNFDMQSKSYESILSYKSSPTVIYNRFTGVGINTTRNYNAIKIDESTFSDIGCNTMNNTRVGIEFKGNCDGTRLMTNEFKTHHIGLHMQGNAKIGKQIRRENTWPISTPSSSFEAKFSGRTLTNQIDRVWIKESQMQISNLNLSSPLWASPRIIGDMEMDNFTWFANPTLPGKLDVCYVKQAESRTSSEDSLINGHYIVYKEYDAAYAEADLLLLARLMHDNSLMPSGSAAEAWFNHYNNPVTLQLAKVYLVMTENLSQISPTDQLLLDENNLLIEKRLENIASIEAQIASGTSTSIAQLLSQKAMYLQELNAKSAENNAKLGSIGAEMSTKTAALYGDVNAINTITEYDADLKFVMQQQLLSSFSGAEPDKAAQEKLLTIAQKCRYSGGLGVLMARASIPTVGDWERFDKECPEVTKARGTSRPSATNIGLVYPNPTADVFTLQFEKEVPSGEIVLRDQFGKFCHSWNIEKQYLVTCPLPTSIPTGMYFVEFRGDPAQRTQTYRLFVNREK